MKYFPFLPRWPFQLYRFMTASREFHLTHNPLEGYGWLLKPTAQGSHLGRDALGLGALLPLSLKQ
ncbi:MAG: hypothetical protein G5Z42_00195 [Caldisphaeraceae archaeon]|nr:hypothetical protein [Caldisphaeraceae archaeon]